MISRIALFIAALAAALTLTVALTTAGFAPGSSQPVSASTGITSPPAVAVAEAVTPPPVQIDTIYLAPAPKQETITVKQVVASSRSEGAESGEGEEGDD
jgi:hypothetical protein